MIEKSVYQVTCDVKNCKNYAQFTLPAKGRTGKFYLCRHCLETLAEEERKLAVPKSPRNAIKKGLEKKAAATEELA